MILLGHHHTQSETDPVIVFYFGSYEAFQISGFPETCPNIATASQLSGGPRRILPSQTLQFSTFPDLNPNFPEADGSIFFSVREKMQQDMEAGAFFWFVLQKTSLLSTLW